MNDSWDVALQGQQDIQPESAAETDLQEDARRGQEYGGNQSYDSQAVSPWTELAGKAGPRSGILATVRQAASGSLGRFAGG